MFKKVLNDVIISFSNVHLYLSIKLHQTIYLYFPFLLSASFSFSSFSFSHSLLILFSSHPPVKRLALPLNKMLVFQGLAHWQNNFTSSCFTPLIPPPLRPWESATIHSPSGKNLNPLSQEDTRFSGRCTLAYKFQFI